MMSLPLVAPGYIVCAQDNYLMLTDDLPAVLVKHTALLNCGMDIDIYRLEI